MSSSTQDTERLWTPPPQEAEQAVHGLLSHLKFEKVGDKVTAGGVLLPHLRFCGRSPRQRVVEVVRHYLLVAVTEKQNNEIGAELFI